MVTALWPIGESAPLISSTVRTANKKVGNRVRQVPVSRARCEGFSGVVPHRGRRGPSSISAVAGRTSLPFKTGATSAIWRLPAMHRRGWRGRGSRPLPLQCGTSTSRPMSCSTPQRLRGADSGILSAEWPLWCAGAWRRHAAPAERPNAVVASSGELGIAADGRIIRAAHGGALGLTFSRSGVRVEPLPLPSPSGRDQVAASSLTRVIAHSVGRSPRAMVSRS